MEFHLLSVPDLVEAKKTQRSKDWPVIEALVAIHCTENSSAPNHDWIRFWLMEARSPELLVELCTRFQKEALDLQKDRPLLSVGIQGDAPLLRAEIQTETMREQEKGRLYWEPLKREMEEFRRAERTAPQKNSRPGCPGGTSPRMPSLPREPIRTLDMLVRRVFGYTRHFSQAVRASPPP